MALRMKTSGPAVDHMLDADSLTMSLTTLEKAAGALGHRVKLELIPA
jgi:hypothetical protein